MTLRYRSLLCIQVLAVSPIQASSFQGLGDLPGGSFSSMAQRVSFDGSVVVGEATTGSGAQAFRWTPSTGMVSLGNLPDHSFKSSAAIGVSSDGSVIVGNGDPAGEGWKTRRGFRWTRTTGMVDIGSLNGSIRYEAFGVSEDGACVVGDGGAQAFRWTVPGGTAGLGVLSGRKNSRAVAVSADGSVATGSSYNLPDWDAEQAFRWTQAGGVEGLGYLPGGNSSFANAISSDGSVIVGTASSPSGNPAFRWTKNEGMVSLGTLPGRPTAHPFGVSRYGAIVVGASYSSPTDGVAFIWDAAHGMRVLQDVLQSEFGLDLTGWKLKAAFSITPDGSVIVGAGINPAGQQEAFRAVLTGATQATGATAAPNHLPTQR